MVSNVFRLPGRVTNRRRKSVAGHLLPFATGSFPDAAWLPLVRCDPHFSDKHRLPRAKFMAISQRRQTSLRRTGFRLPLAERSRELSPRIQPRTNSTRAARSLRPPQGLDPNLQCCVHRHEPGFRCTLEVVPHEAHQQAAEDLALYEARAAWRRSGQDSKEMLAIE